MDDDEGIGGIGAAAADDPGGRPLFLGWISEASSAAEAAAAVAADGPPEVVGSFLLVALENRPENRIKILYSLIRRLLINVNPEKNLTHANFNPIQPYIYRVVQLGQDSIEKILSSRNSSQNYT